MIDDLQRKLCEALADLNSCQRLVHECIELAVDRGLAQKAARLRGLHDEMISLARDVSEEVSD